MSSANATHRLVKAERQGLRLAIFCRTLAVSAGFIWFIGASLAVGAAPNPWGFAALLAFTLFGVLNLFIIGTRYERWWLKYVIYTVDILGMCALFAVLPPSSGADVPQIVAFRAYGIYYLFPLIAMACLSLSWRLVAWSGIVAVLGWWGAFAVVVRGMERSLSWGDMPPGATRQDYETIFLSIDFIGVGNRVEETGFLLISALILAVAVYRARLVFFRQIAAEAEREAERAARERITQSLGRYVPETIADRLIADESALAPQVRHAAILVMDIRAFTAFAAERPPAEVIDTLNTFLARCSEIISARDGVIISFTGDGLIAAFNTPLEVPDPEGAAVESALALVEHARTTSFGIRVGVSAGPVAAGSVGSSERQAFTVYGDTVNRAARLEALAKDLDADILVDEGVMASGKEWPGQRSHGLQNLKGMADPVPVWSVSDET